MQRMREKGFTLVEIAIVMVIIGLLLGGALKGQQMIESAKIKSLKRFHDEFKAAYYFYQDTYRYLPGDDPGAERFDAVSTGAKVGNANGLVEGHWRASGGTSESENVWRDLAASGLFGGGVPPVTNSNWGLGARIPENVFGGVAGFEYNTGSGYLGYPVLCFNALSNDVAMKIDAAYDDGVAETGIVFATDDGADKRLKAYDYSGEKGTLCFQL